MFSKLLAEATIFLLIKWKENFVKSNDISNFDVTLENQNQLDYCMVHPNHFLCITRNMLCQNGTDFYPKNSSDNKKIVDLLNKIRAKVASGNETRGGKSLPQASDMLQLKWDSELEEAAANIVRRCQGRFQFQFCCRCNVFSRFEVNLIQHLFLKENPTPEWKNYFNFLKSKNEDQIHLSEINNLSQPFLLTDGFLLMIKAEVSLVGCNVAIYAAMNGGFVHNFVCIFGGISKWTGFPVYSEGVPCSQCPLDSICSDDYQELCSCVKKCEYPLKSNQSLSNGVFSFEAETWIANNHPKNSTNQTIDLINESSNDTLEIQWTEYTNFNEDQILPWSQNGSTLQMDYCRKNKRHILCAENEKQIEEGYCPKRKKFFPQTEYDRMNILNVFNAYRMQVAIGNETFNINEDNITLPSAANFMELRWDYELEAASRNLVHLCQIRIFEFCCDCNKFDRFSVNLFQLKLINNNVLSLHWPSWDYFLDAMKRDYIASYLLIAPIDSPIHHSYYLNQFGVLLSSEISLIGCSVAMYYIGNNFVHHPVCVVAGFTDGDEAVSYLEGEPCSECSSNSKCSESYPGLCNSEIQEGRSRSKKEMKFNHKTIARSFISPQIEYTREEPLYIDDEFFEAEDDTTNLHERSSASQYPPKKVISDVLTSTAPSLAKANVFLLIAGILLVMNIF